MGVTVRRLSGASGDRILVRSRFTCDPSMEVPDSRLRSVGSRHDAQFRERFPMLGEVDMEYRWAGHLCLSINGVPAFGEIEPNLYSACCQNGLGVTRGTLSGLAAAEYAMGIESQLVTDMLAMDQPGKLPPRPLTWLGANAVMRYKELRAGRE